MFRAHPFAGDGGGGRAADGVAPVLVDDGERLAALRLRQHDVARAAERAHGVALAIVVIVVEANAGRRDVLEEDRLHVPVVVEAVGDVELEALRVRQHHAAAGMHAIDLLADAQRVRDVEQRERVLIRNEQDAFVIAHVRSGKIVRNTTR